MTKEIIDAACRVVAIDAEYMRENTCLFNGSNQRAVNGIKIDEIKRDRTFLKRLIMVFQHSAILLFVMSSFPLYGASVNLGDLSFNTLIPSAPGSPGINQFEVDNFTGAFALPPDFAAMSGLSFDSATLLLNLVGGSTQTVALGDLTEGSNTPLSVQFSASNGFTSAQLTATLNQTKFSLAGGSSFNAASGQINVLLTPASGTTLVPDTDFALITISGTSTAIPEPPGIWLATALVLIIVFRSR